MSNPNTQTVSLTDGREVLLSYGVPVAAFIPGQGYVKTDRKFSVTSSRHANAYCRGAYRIVADKDFCEMIAPIEAKGR